MPRYQGDDPTTPQLQWLEDLVLACVASVALCCRELLRLGWVAVRAVFVSP